MTPTVVFDCVVLLQAAAYPGGPAGACFAAVRNRKVRLVVSADTLDEVERVLDRPGVRKSFKTLTAECVEKFLDQLFSVARLVHPVPGQFSLPRDPNDEMYVNLALAAGAKLLVSRDNDLLDLMGDQAFTTTYPGLTILDPAAFLQTLPP